MRSIPVILVSALAVGAFVVGGSAMLAAPDQVTSLPQATPIPGQPTQAQVWVMNSGQAEAVPVNLRDATLDAPLRVHIVNAETGGTEPVHATLARQPWEYMTLTIPADAKPAPLVDQQGAAGWETTGIAWTTADGTTLLMKRPR